MLTLSSKASYSAHSGFEGGFHALISLVEFVGVISSVQKDVFLLNRFDGLPGFEGLSLLLSLPKSAI
jgi:hypothetical protein